MNDIVANLWDQKSIVVLSIRQQLGRRFLLLPLFILAWPILTTIVMYLLDERLNVGPEEVQNLLIGFPLYALAIGVGSGIITNEIEQRTLEVTYTIPGGARRVWLLKLGTATLLILFAELMMAVCVWFLYTTFPLSVIPGAFRASIFLLVLSMGMGALLKNELFAVISTIGIGFALLVPTMEGVYTRWSPFFDPILIEEITPREYLAFTIQNYVCFTLITLALAGLAFSRAERREQLLE